MHYLPKKEKFLIQKFIQARYTNIDKGLVDKNSFNLLIPVFLKSLTKMIT